MPLFKIVVVKAVVALVPMLLSVLLNRWADNMLAEDDKS